MDNWYGKRYYSLNAYFQNRFGEKVHRISLDAGFTCPNRDGLISTGGCVYCGEAGARASYVDPEKDLSEQLRSGIEHIWKKTGARKYIAYFQAYSNTYADVPKLRSLYEEALSFPEVVGLSIGTRPDCIDAEKLDLLEEFARKTYVLIEYGVQTLDNKSLTTLNRGHSAEVSLDAIRDTKKRKSLDVLAHMILGLPGEDTAATLESIQKLVQYGTDAFKFHQLYVERDTVLEKWLREGRMNPLTLDEYLDTIEKILPIIPKDCVIHRLFADCSREKLLAPLWTLDKARSMALLDKRLQDKNITQGMLC